MEAPPNGAMGPCWLTLEPCRLVVADSRHFAAEPDHDPHQNEKRDPDRHFK